MKPEIGYMIELFPRSKRMKRGFEVFWTKKKAVEQILSLPRDARPDIIKVKVIPIP